MIVEKVGGADVQRKNRAGHTPLAVAVDAGHMDVTVALLAAGGQVTDLFEGRTLLDHARLHRFSDALIKDSSLSLSDLLLLLICFHVHLASRRDIR